MRPLDHHKRLTVAAAAAAALAAFAVPARADHRPTAVDAAATISSCRGDSLVIAAQIAPAKGRKVKRAVRRAQLRLRFEAAPLYGGSRRSREFNLGRTTRARRFVRFSDLRAQAYTGIVRYRWVRGKRTVLSGFTRTRKGRVAGRRGRATCTLKVGRRPVDTQPPFIAPIPSDSAWKRSPLSVYLWAVDDLSGVALVLSRIDSGSFQRGRHVEIAAEGSHRLEYLARDAAGNQSEPAAVTLRVDARAPTRPVISAPSGTITSSRPVIRWSASTDSASGLGSYTAAVRNSQGTIVWSQAVPASATSVTVGRTLAAGNYTAAVTAYDRAQPDPFSSTGTRAFTVSSG